MTLILLFLAYILVGSIVVVLATYVSDDIFDEFPNPILAVLWPILVLPTLMMGAIRKLLDHIFKD